MANVFNVKNDDDNKSLEKGKFSTTDLDSHEYMVVVGCITIILSDTITT